MKEIDMLPTALGVVSGRLTAERLTEPELRFFLEDDTTGSRNDARKFFADKHVSNLIRQKAEGILMRAMVANRADDLPPTREKSNSALAEQPPLTEGLLQNLLVELGKAKEIIEELLRGQCDLDDDVWEAYRARAREFAGCGLPSEGKIQEATPPSMDDAVAAITVVVQ